MIGEYLYKVLDRDFQFIEPFYLARSFGAVAASVNQTFQMPLDRVALVTHFAATLTPGAAQFPVDFVAIGQDAVRFTQASPIIVDRDFTRPVPAANATVRITEPALMVHLPPGVVVSVTGNFNAGAAQNFVNFTMHGWLLPRGNLTFAVF